MRSLTMLICSAAFVLNRAMHRYAPASLCYAARQIHACAADQGMLAPFQSLAASLERLPKLCNQSSVAERSLSLLARCAGLGVGHLEMGLDGGTTITRSDVLRGSSWRLATCDTSRSTRGGAVSGHGTYQAERADPELVRRDRLNSCYLSSVDLQPPIVSDYMGNLYTKASLLEFLLARDHGQFSDVEAEHRHQNIMRTHPDGLKHIRGRKDVVEVCAHPQEAAKPAPDCEVVAAPPQPTVGQMANLQCPISQLPFLKNRVALLVPCGHAFCYSVIDMLQTGAGSDSVYHCPSCNKGFKVPNGVVELAADGEQKQRLEKSLLRKRKGKTGVGDGASKASKKRLKGMEEIGQVTQTPK